MTWQIRSSLTPKVLSENQWQLHWLCVEKESTHFQQGMSLYCRVRKKPTNQPTRSIGTVLGLFHIKRTLLFSQRVKIQLLPIHSKHMVLWPSGCTKLSSKILEHGIIINILKSSLKFSMEKCTASGEDILFNNVNLATMKLWYASMKEWMVIWISLYYT